MSIATAPLSSYASSLRDAPVPPELAALRACPVFATAVASSVQALARASSLKHFAPAATIGHEGAPFDAAFLVVRGRVRAVRRGESGREVTAETFRANDLVADAALDAGAGLPTDLVAAAPTLLLFIPRDALVAHMRVSPETGINLGREAARRLRRSKDLAVGLALTDVRSRVVWALGRLARDAGDGVDTPEGYLIRQRPTQQELANVVGSCRETVSRLVSDLVRQGLLAPRGRGLLVSRRLLDGGAGPAAAGC